MATFESDDENITGEVTMGVIYSHIEITEVYWKNTMGKRIDKLVPKSKAILCIQTENYESYKNENITITLEHSGGQAVRKNLSKTEKVKVNNDGYAEKEYKWESDDTIVAKVMGKNEMKSPELVKEWGIWIKPLDGSDMHFFNPTRPCIEVDRFIKSVYEAYLYFKGRDVSQVFDFHLNKKHDVHIIFEKNADNTRFEHEKNEKNIHELRWHDRKGLEIENQNKEIIFQSPASALLHELGHGVHYFVVGKIEYINLSKQDPLDIKFHNRYKTTNRLEEIIVNEYENPACQVMGEGVRNRYHGIFHDVPSVTSIPLINTLRR